MCTNCGTPISPTQEAGVRTEPQDITPDPPSRSTDPIGAASSDKVIRLRSRQVAFLGALTALILLGAIAAGALTAPEATPSGQLVAQLPFDEDGGKASFDDGAGSISVPKGALDGPATIDVRRSPLRQRVTASSPTGQSLTFLPGALVVYIFGPTTLTFNRPVTITFALPVDGQTGLIFATSQGQLRFYTGNVDGDRITIQLNSFDLTQPNAIIRT